MEFTLLCQLKKLKHTVMCVFVHTYIHAHKHTAYFTSRQCKTLKGVNLSKLKFCLLCMNLLFIVKIACKYNYIAGLSR